MKHAIKCKLCKAPHVIETDDSYSELGDPFKLLPLFTCNSCYDLREKRVGMERQIERWCRMLILQPKMPATDRVAIKDGLLVVTRKYVEVIGQIYGAQRVWHDPEFVNLLMDRPERFGAIIANYCKMVRDNIKQAA